MAAVLRFAAWVLTQAWRLGLATARRIAAWAKANWRKVAKWLASGLGFEAILQLIKRALGIR